MTSTWWCELDLKRRASTIIFLFLASLLVAWPVLAAAERVEVDFFGQVNYLLRDDMLLAEGGVEIRHQGLTLKGESLVVDLANNHLELAGGATLLLEEGEIKGEALHYDLSTGEWSFFAAQATIEVPKFNSPVYLLGEVFEGAPQRLVITNGTATTCSLQEPHYHLQAERLEIYPDDRIVIRNVVYREGKIPLFYWPYLSLPIREEGRLNLPEIGYTVAGGWFIGAKWDVRLHENLWGKVHGQYHQRTGFVLGFSGDYRLGDNQTGRFSTEYRQNRPVGGGQWRGSLSHQLSLGPLTLSGILDRRINYTFSGISRDVLQSQLQLWGQWGNTTASAAMSYSVTETPSKTTEQLGGELRLSTKLGQDWSTNVQGKYATKQEGTAFQKRVEYQAQLSRNRSDYRFDLVLAQTFNPGLETGQDVTWHSISKLPELSLSTVSRHLGSWPYDFALKVGRYREEPQGIEAIRSTVEFNLKNKSYQLAEGMRLDLSSTQSGSIYGADTYYFRLHPKATLDWQLFGGLRMQTTFQIQQGIGETPFASERVTPSRLLTGKLVYNNDWMDWSLSGGYNFRTGLLQNITASFQMEGAQGEGGWKLGVSGVFNPYLSTLVSVTGLFEKSFGEDYAVRLGVSYDPLKQRLERFDAQLNLKLSDTWTLAYAGIYSGSEGKWERGDLALSKDLHCREVVFRYNQVDNMVWAEYRIYAFPDGRFRLGTSGEQFMFDAAGWQNLFP